MVFKKVLITGGAGYVGSLLTPQLLEAGYDVTVFDILYFGDHFLPKDNPRLKVVQGDIRDRAALRNVMEGIDAVISLACISNDASFELDERLSTSINLDAFEPMVVAAKSAGVAWPRGSIFGSRRRYLAIASRSTSTRTVPWSR